VIHGIWPYDTSLIKNIRRASAVKHDHWTAHIDASEITSDRFDFIERFIKYDHLALIYYQMDGKSQPFPTSVIFLHTKKLIGWYVLRSILTSGPWFMAICQLFNRIISVSTCRWYPTSFETSQMTTVLYSNEWFMSYGHITLDQKPLIRNEHRFSTAVNYRTCHISELMEQCRTIPLSGSWILVT
jgi:hypothetical protein